MLVLLSSRQPFRQAGKTSTTIFVISPNSFHINQISSSDYTDIDFSKYHKINLGKTIFWPWVLKTPGPNCKIGNFESSSIWLKQALERENQLQKYLLLSCLLPTFSK